MERVYILVSFGDFLYAALRLQGQWNVSANGWYAIQWMQNIFTIYFYFTKILFQVYIATNSHD